MERITRGASRSSSQAPSGAGGDRLERLETTLQEFGATWRLYPVVQALQALRAVQWLVAITAVAELGDLTRFGRPYQSRQRPRPSRVDRRGLGVSAPGESLAAHPDAD